MFLKTSEKQFGCITAVLKKILRAGQTTFCKNYQFFAGDFMRTACSLGTFSKNCRQCWAVIRHGQMIQWGSHRALDDLNNSQFQVKHRLTSVTAALKSLRTWFGYSITIHKTIWEPVKYPATRETTSSLPLVSWN